MMYSMISAAVTTFLLEHPEILKAIFYWQIFFFCLFYPRIHVNKMSQPNESKQGPNSSNNNLPIVYVYDHCPYCIRVRIILGLKNIPHKIEYLGNSDEKSHIDLCGSKQVPILKKSNGEILLESMDIVKYFDELDGKPILKPSAKKPPYENYKSNNKLTHPRFIQLDLPEFCKPEDIAYFTKKKEKDIGNLAENIENSANLRADEDLILMELGKHFPTLDELKSREIPGINGNYWSYDDINIFSRLRGLTSVKDIRFPDNINYYIDTLAQKANIPLYYDKAI